MVSAVVSVAERSKAPDSSGSTFWDFWSSDEGVGSNPTADTIFSLLPPPPLSLLLERETVAMGRKGGDNRELVAVGWEGGKRPIDHTPAFTDPIRWMRRAEQS